MARREVDARAPRGYEGATAIAVSRIVVMVVRTVGLAALLALAGCGGDAEEVEAPVLEEPAVHVAFARDFERFERWTTFDRGRDPVPPSHIGPSLIYVTPPPPEGAEAFPVGTRIVRVERIGEDPAAWEVHAMVKRGGGFNQDGAAGWGVLRALARLEPQAARHPLARRGPRQRRRLRRPRGGRGPRLQPLPRVRHLQRLRAQPRAPAERSGPEVKLRCSQSRPAPSRSHVCSCSPRAAAPPTPRTPGRTPALLRRATRGATPGRSATTPGPSRASRRRRPRRRAPPAPSGGGAMPWQTIGEEHPIGEDIPIDHIFILMQENRSF
ncbi:MAG: hypothetical protein M5U28_46805 [Sandaracinaceae bacterium]|nr:hypothetical protein [Sandaracinaceae bacterium]